LLVFSVGSPGSPVGLCLDGVGIGAASVAGIGEGDESGFCGKACSPTPGVETGEEAGIEGAFGSCGKSGNASLGLGTADGTGVCARRGAGRLALRHTSAIKRLFRGTDLLVSILVQSFLAFALSRAASAGDFCGLDRIGPL
jgi:hypothetical protein